jgi:hypothetical protein
MFYVCIQKNAKSVEKIVNHADGKFSITIIERTTDMKVYLDDIRPTPDGWTRTYTVEQTIELLKTGQVEELSLDNDLGSGQPEGFEVMKWLEEQVIAHGFTTVPRHWRFHTDNIPRRWEMKAAARAIMNFLGRHEGDR